jgi:N-acetylneuraminate synthase
MKTEKGHKQNKVFIIAEAGVNHNGSIEMAKQLIDIAAETGADAVKFQTFKAENLVSKHAPKAEYQKKTTAEEESQLEMIRKLELGEDAHHLLIKHCKFRNIEFLSSPFDFESIEFLAHTLNLPRIKIPSGEITNGPYLLQVAKTGKPVILSTGMSTIGEIETALGVLAFGYLPNHNEPSLEKFRDVYCSETGRKTLEKKVILLHCTTEYPAPFEEVNLRALETLRIAFGLPIGLSDHTPGIAVPIAAVALGASVIEKHITLDRNLPGPDHKASLEPDEMKAMVAAIRQIEAALGNGLKIPSPSEWKNRTVARKSLTASCQIKKNELFTENNISIKRPGTGLSPMLYWSLYNRKALKDYEQDEMLSE